MTSVPTHPKAKKTTSYVLEYGDAIRLEVNDGKPMLLAKNEYAEAQEQDPWDVIADGDDVFEMVVELQQFLDKHAMRGPTR